MTQADLFPMDFNLASGVTRDGERDLERRRAIEFAQAVEDKAQGRLFEDGSRVPNLVYQG